MLETFAQHEGQDDHLQPGSKGTLNPENPSNYPQDVTRFKSDKRLCVNNLQEINEDIDNHV